MSIHQKSGDRARRIRDRSESSRGAGTAWPELRHRTRSAIEHFLRSAIPSPEPVFPDSGSPFAQFPTLRFLNVRRTGPDPSIWDEPEERLEAAAKDERPVPPDRVSDAWFLCRPDK